MAGSLAAHDAASRVQSGVVLPVLKEGTVKTVGLWALAAVALLVTSSGYTPYAMPYVEQPAADDAGSFDGLIDLAKSLPASTPVKVLWTHGMCTHPSSWVDDRLQLLATAAGGRTETLEVRPVGRHGATLRTERITMPNRTIEVKFLNWSPLTAPYKKALAYNRPTFDHGTTAYQRAILNKELKAGLVNDCLTDVVVYSGPNGQIIREAMQEAACDSMGGRMAGGRCDMAEGASPAMLGIVTESLGAKLLFDALLTLWDNVSGNPDQTRRLATGLAAIKTMYLLSNQLPLLDSAGPPSAGVGLAAMAPALPRRGDVSDVFGVLAHARRLFAPTTPPMTVVAFSDPNDLLTYRLTPASLAGHLDDFRVINVIVSNDTTFLGYVERPDTAHCGYTWNAHVYELLARGYRAGELIPEPAGRSGGSCVIYMGVRQSGSGGR